MGGTMVKAGRAVKVLNRAAGGPQAAPIPRLAKP
jgi:hypothetical protein